jgi:hypothetical protein
VFEVGFQAALNTTNKLFRTKLVTPSASNTPPPHARPQVGGKAGAPGLPKGKTKRGWGTRTGLLDDDHAWKAHTEHTHHRDASHRHQDHVEDAT